MGMAAGMDITEASSGNMRVDGRGVEPGVSQLALNGPEVRSVIEEVSGAGVTEQMRAAGLGDLGGPHPLFDQMPNGANCES